MSADAAGSGWGLHVAKPKHKDFLLGRDASMRNPAESQWPARLVRGRTEARGSWCIMAASCLQNSSVSFGPDSARQAWESACGLLTVRVPEIGRASCRERV